MTLILLKPEIVLAGGVVTLQDTYKIDTPVFTQGLELIEDKLVLGTGLYGESAIGWLDLNTGKYQIEDSLDEAYFGEGLTATPQFLWQFTWQEQIAFKRNLDDLKMIEQVAFEGNGWGMAYDEDLDVIWTSDGSNQITKRDPLTFEKLDSLNVSFNGEKVQNINELEFANGMIYANVWQTNLIIQINLETGNVKNQWDLSQLVKELSFENNDPDRVLNGIAHIKGNEFYVTGKLFPVIWKVSLD